MALHVDTGPHAARGRCAVAALAALCLLLPTIAGADRPSAGVLLRHARYAVAEGRTRDAIDALRTVRTTEPRSQRGLEAALLLADVELKGGDAAAADRTLAEAGGDFPDGDGAAQLLLARGWLALARGDATAALQQFELVPARSGERPARELAQLGIGWARLVGSTERPDVPHELSTLAASAQDPTLRIGALLSLARTHQARGDHRQALRALRATRRLVRRTSLEDDVELGIGLVQLDMGRLAAARRTLTHLAAEGTTTEASALPAGASSLTLADLRLPPAAFAARLAALYAGQVQPGIDLRHFLGATLDRPAGKDAAAALDLATVAIAAGKDA
jgi:ATP/maltotriose-dependent transcriptional regulator MalT